jgi:cysteine-rich repeat protein
MKLNYKIVTGCALGALALAGCPGETMDVDAAVGPMTDAYTTLDTGPRDAGPRPDAYVPPGTDAGMPMPDAYVPPMVDAGPMDVCGDGTLAATGEECDDGNTDAGDGCDATCAPEAGWDCDMASPTVCAEICGDGTVVGDEAGASGCDDGDTTGGDGCDATCAVEPGYSCTGEPSVCMAGCGDGIIAGTEACDDGDMADGDGCSAACAIEPGYTCSGTPSVCATRCGDGLVGGAEACDDMNTTAGDGCDASCAVERGYTCAGAPSACATRCGDGVTAGAEMCDDGNTATEACRYGERSCTVCSATCTSVPGATSLCGDMIVDPAEEACDDGNASSETACAYGTATCTACDATCDAVLSLRGNVCGDGVLGGAEACDDGDTMGMDGCSATCTVEAGYSCTGIPSVCATVCGDGTLAGAEACDDGNTNTEPCDYGSMSCTVCDAMCRLVPGVVSNCGDGIVNGAERCDDGNLIDTDGCSGCFVQRGWICSTFMGRSSCRTECGDGIIAGAEACDDANTRNADGCSGVCAVEPSYSCSGEPSVCTRDFTLRYTGAAVSIPDPGSVAATFSGTTAACTIGAITEVSLRINHSWVGDVSLDLRRPDGTTVRLLGRPNLNPPGTCCGSSSDLGGVYVFRDDAAAPFPETPANPVPTGTYRATDDFGAAVSMSAALAGGSAVGTWAIVASDGAGIDSGSFDTITVTGRCM